MHRLICAVHLNLLQLLVVAVALALGLGVGLGTRSDGENPSGVTEKQGAGTGYSTVTVSEPICEKSPSSDLDQV